MSTVNIDTFVPKKDHVFILDTNVLIKIFYPMDSSSKGAPYIDLYSKICKLHSVIIVSSVQISEFINRCIRFQFELWKYESQNMSADFKKDYRETKNYRESMNAILDIVKSDIMSNSTYICDNFDKMNFDNLYQYGFSYDFNDSLIAEIARINNATLITDDRDFANYHSNITIVTGNRALLMF